MLRAIFGLAWLAVSFSAPAQPLTMAVSHSPLSLPIYVAESQKFFADEGLAVKTVECIGGERCFSMLLDGSAALASVVELTLIFNGLVSSDVAILATFASSTSNLRLITRKSTGITRAAQLVGKRVGTVKASGAHYFLDTSLMFDGVDPKRIELVLLPPEQIGQALQDGRIDAASIWEPFAQDALRQLAGDGLIISGPRAYTLTFNLIAGRKLIAERQADLIKVLRALSRAQQFIRAQPQQAQAILMQRLRQDQAYIDATWSGFNYRLSLDQSLLITLEGQGRWALREGHVPRSSRIPNVLQLVAPEALRKLDPGAVTLIN